MDKLFFKEVEVEELNSHVTDFWTGFGIGSRFRRSRCWISSCLNIMNRIAIPTLVTLLTLIVFGLLIIITNEHLAIIIPVSLLLVIFSSFLLGNVLKYRQE